MKSLLSISLSSTIEKREHLPRAESIMSQRLSKKQSSKATDSKRRKEFNLRLNCSTGESLSLTGVSAEELQLKIETWMTENQLLAQHQEISSENTLLNWNHVYKKYGALALEKMSTSKIIEQILQTLDTNLIEYLVETREVSTLQYTQTIRKVLQRLPEKTAEDVCYTLLQVALKNDTQAERSSAFSRDLCSAFFQVCKRDATTGQRILDFSLKNNLNFRPSRNPDLIPEIIQQQLIAQNIARKKLRLRGERLESVVKNPILRQAILEELITTKRQALEAIRALEIQETSTIRLSQKL
jgi:hypothetical protein